MAYDSVSRSGITRFTTFGASLVAIAALAACYTGGSIIDDVNAGPTAGGATTTSHGAIPGELPCDVAQILSDSCASCHGGTLSGGAPSRLVSYGDLTSPSITDPSKKEIEVVIQRMKDTKTPMPTAGLLPASQVAVLEQWLASGLPKGTCGGTSAFDTPSVCTSNRTWRGKEGSSMAPGEACIACHSQEREGPRYDFAGTVYPTAHEPDDCLGVNGSSGVKVVITGADGATLTIPVNSAGNFATRARTRIVMPYTAKVVMGDKERAMATPQTDGDCNGCHTESGANRAPGRVVLP